MIQKLNLLHYLSEDTYKKICLNFNLETSESITNNFVTFTDEKIRKISLFNIFYKQFGRIWFMDVEIDYPKFDCTYDTFEQNLYDHYYSVFGDKIMDDFPSYDQLCCNYIEYSSVIKAANTSDIIKKLKTKCKPEQLDKSLWEQYKKPHGIIEFCVSVNKDIIEILARCHGTALKKRILDPSLHRTVGLIPSAAINDSTENYILNWLYKKHGIEVKTPLIY